MGNGKPLKKIPIRPQDILKKDMTRAWAKLEVTPTGCLLWRGAVNNSGYANFFLAGKVIALHRMMWVWANQKEIPQGLDLDHLCRVRNCVAPNHLEPVSRKENVVRGDNSYEGEEKCRRGHDLTAPNAFLVSKMGSRQCRLCRNERAREVHRENMKNPEWAEARRARMRDERRRRNEKKRTEGNG